MNDNKLLHISLCQLSYPEATLWAVVPKQEWEATKHWNMKEILELIEKYASGTTFREAIKEEEQISRMPISFFQKEYESLQKEKEELTPIVEKILEKHSLPPSLEEKRLDEIRIRQDVLYKQMRRIYEASAAKESLEQQLEQLVQRLEELQEQGNLEIEVSPTDELIQMTPEELKVAECKLLYPDSEYFD